MVLKKAIILCAGLGTRLKPFTDSTPKALVKIGDKPILWYILQLLKKHQIESVGINLFHLHQKIRDYLKENANFGLEIVTKLEKELLGTAGGVRNFEDFIGYDDSFLVIYGDVLTNANLKKIIDFHQRVRADLTMAIRPWPNPEEKGIVRLGLDGRITEFIEKPHGYEVFTNLGNAAIYVCQKSILPLIPENQFSDFGIDVFPKMLNKGLGIYGYIVRKYLIDVGNKRSLRQANDDLRMGVFKI